MPDVAQLALRIQANTEQAEEALREFQKTLSTLGKAAQDASKQLAAALGDDKGFEKLSQNAKKAEQQTRQAMKQIENAVKASFDAIGQSMHTAFSFALAETLFVPMIRAAEDAAKSLFMFNANMEQTRVAFTQLLGSGEDAAQFLRELAEFSMKTPFELPQVQQAARQLMAYGFAARDVLPLLTAIGDAVSAMGQGAEGIDRAILALGQMAARGHVASQEMLQLTQLGLPVWDILAQKMGVTTAQLQDMVEKGLVPARQAIDLLAQGFEERFGGMMEAQSHTFLGLLSNVKDTLRQTLGEAMAPAFEEAKRQLEAFAAFLETPQFHEWARRMGQEVANLAREIGQFLREHGQQLFELMTKAAESALSLAGSLAEVAKALLAIDQTVTNGQGLQLLFKAWLLNQATGGIVGSAVGGAAGGLAGAAAGGAARGIARTLVSRGLLGAGAVAGGAVAGEGLAAAGAAAGGIALGEIAAVAAPVVAILAAGGLLAYVGYRLYKDTEARIQAEKAAEERAVATQANIAYQLSPEVRAQRQRHLVEENTVFQIQQTSDALKVLIAEETAAREATEALAQAQQLLAGAYQAVLSVQQIYGHQQSEYHGQLQAIKDALDIIHQKELEGIPLSQEEILLKQEAGTLTQRLAGAEKDAAIQKGLLAAANAELILAQDELNKLQAQGITSGTQYEQALARVNAAREKAKALAGENVTMEQLVTEAMKQQHTSFEQLGAVINDRLIPALRDFKSALMAIAAGPVGIELYLAKEKAEQQLEELRQEIARGAILPVSIQGPTAGGVRGGPYAVGGEITHPQLAIVGEDAPAHPEYIIPTNPTFRDRALHLWLAAGRRLGIRGFQAGGSTTVDDADLGVKVSDRYAVKEPKAKTATAPKTRAPSSSHTSAAPASADDAASLKEIVQAYQDALRALNDTLSLAKALADLPDLTLPAQALDALAQFARHAMDALAVVDPGLSEDAAKQFRDFAAGAADALRTFEDAGKLLTELKSVRSRDLQPAQDAVTGLAGVIEHVVASLGDAAQAVTASRGETFLPQLQLFAESAKVTLDTLAAMADTVKTIGRSALDLDALKARISTLKFLVEHAVESLGDSAQAIAASRPDAWLDQLKAFADAAKPALDLLDTVAKTVSALGTRDVPLDALKATLSQLKFLIEHAVVSLGDSAQAIAASRPDDWRENLQAFADAAKPTLDLLTTFTAALSGMTQKTLPVEILRTQLTELKFLIEHAVESLGDSAQLLAASRPSDWLDQLKVFADVARPALDAVRAAVDTISGALGIRRLPPPAALDTLKTWLVQVVTTLADAADAASAQLAETAQEKLQAFTSQAGSALSVVRDVLSLGQEVANLDRIVLPGPNLTRLLVGIATQITQAISEAAADLNAETVNAQAQALASGVNAARDALSLITDLTKTPPLTGQAAEFFARGIADFAVLVARDLSQGVDTLVKESPDLIANLQTFTSDVAPAFSALAGITEQMKAVTSITVIPTGVREIFRGNLETAAQLIHDGVAILEQADPDIERFTQLAENLARALASAQAVLPGSASAGAAQASGVTVTGGRASQPVPPQGTKTVTVNLTLDKKVLQTVVIDTVSGAIRTEV